MEPVGESPSLVERVQRATLTCNIDKKGRRLRLLAGVLALSAGSFSLLGWVLPSANAGLLALALFSMAGGAFMIFEARASWCVIRALGFRTKW